RRAKRPLLLLRRRSPSPPHERLHLLRSKLAVFVAIHCFENSLVSRLKLRQLDGPVTIAVHQSENHAHHHDGRPHRATTHHASTHHAATHHSSLPHHAAHHATLPRAAILSLSLLLIRLGHHRPLRNRAAAVRQNESRYRKHQNVLVHMKPPQTQSPPVQLGPSDMGPLVQALGGPRIPAPRRKGHLCQG